MQPSLKEVVEISQSMLEGDYEKLRTNRMISVENYKIAAILTHTDIKEEDLPEGDEIDICEKREKKTVLSLLKVKLGNVSNQLEQAIQNNSIEKLNTLTLSIFDITNEDDVLKIIN